MIIEKCTISTTTKYEDGETHYAGTPVDYLELIISIPGGIATYTIKLSSGMKESIEKAVSLR